MNLDLRLRMVAGLVRPGKPLVDIGTDHAYLPVFLVKNDIIPSAVAGDIKAGPLGNAIKTISKNELQEKILPVLSDGLCGIPHEYTDFCIAGMGGELIVKILEDSPWVEALGNHFVFQPQTHAEDLRKYLFENGYEILKEDVVKDGTRFYNALEVSYTGEKKQYTASDIYIGKLPESTSIYKSEYLNFIASRLDVRYKATRKKEIKAVIDKIMEAAL